MDEGSGRERVGTNSEMCSSAQIRKRSGAQNISAIASRIVVSRLATFPEEMGHNSGHIHAIHLKALLCHFNGRVRSGICVS